MGERSTPWRGSCQRRGWRNGYPETRTSICLMRCRVGAPAEALEGQLAGALREGRRPRARPSSGAGRRSSSWRGSLSDPGGSARCWRDRTCWAMPIRDRRGDTRGWPMRHWWTSSGIASVRFVSSSIKRAGRRIRASRRREPRRRRPRGLRGGLPRAQQAAGPAPRLRAAPPCGGRCARHPITPRRSLRYAKKSEKRRSLGTPRFSLL